MALPPFPPHRPLSPAARGDAPPPLVRQEAPAGSGVLCFLRLPCLPGREGPGRACLPPIPRFG